MHMQAFLLFSVVIHGSGFYLFKVVYPFPVREVNEPDQITVLDSSDPAVRTVLQRITDRTIYLLPPSGDTDVRVGLDARQVRFTPAFQRNDMELRKPTSAAAVPGLTLPLEPEQKSGENGAPIASLHMKVDPALSVRELAPWSIMHDYLGAPVILPLMRIQLEIAPVGEVDVTGVEAGLSESEKLEIAQVIESTLRFSPASESDSGWIEIGGEN